MRVLLSIKPEYVEKIFNGQKRFEYRRAIFTQKDVETIIVYATMPVGKIVGEFKIAQILHDSPNAIWEKTRAYSGVKKSFYNEYFKNRERAFAIQISDIMLYDTPINPKELDEKFVAPQSFKYWKPTVSV